MTTNDLLLAMIALLVVWLGYLEFRLRQLFRGQKGTSLETVLANVQKELERFALSERDQNTYLRNLSTRLAKSLQGVGLVRFNPFREVGSNQSFATALLDEQGDGIVISTLYTRDKTSVFGKPIIRFESEYEITPEEIEAIAHARARTAS